MLGSLAYDARGMVEPGPTWALRFVMLRGVVVGAVVASSGRDDLWRQSASSWFRTPIVASVVIQAALLALFKGYDPTIRLRQALPGSQNVRVVRLPDRRRSFLGCLRDSLPTATRRMGSGNRRSSFVSPVDDCRRIVAAPCFRRP